MTLLLGAMAVCLAVGLSVGVLFSWLMDRYPRIFIIPQDKPESEREQ